MAVSWLTALSYCQTPGSAVIRGQVFDSAGAVLAGADIQLDNRSTGFQHRTTTGPQGYYALPDLPLTGQYRIRFSKMGFAGDEVTGVELQAGEVATVNATLQPEGGRSQITV